MRVMRKLPVVPICRMRAALSKDTNQQHICAVPLSQKGRFAIVTNVGSGMRWTRQRVRRARLKRTAKSCGPGAPGLALSLQNDDLQMTVTKKSWTPRRARSSVNTIAQGVPDRSGEPVVTYSCATL